MLSLFMTLFTTQKFSILINYNLFISILVTCAFDVVAKEPLLNPTSHKFTHVFTCNILGLFKNFLVVQWLGLHSFTAGSMDSIPGQGTKIPPGTQWRYIYIYIYIYICFSS